MKITLYENSKKVHQTTDSELERIPNIGEFMCIDEVGYDVIDIHTIFNTITEEVELIICLNKCS
nr:MAG TPA: hypothetical protein [Crassvirales sp.]